MSTIRPDISLFASSVRPHLWPAFFKSLEKTNLVIEVVFAGDLYPLQMGGYSLPEFIKTPEYSMRPLLAGEKYEKDIIKNFKYITTGKIKPAQCYEIARRHCTGLAIGWVCDDAEFDPYMLDEALDLLKKSDSPYKTVVALATNEDGRDCPLNDHRFYGDNVNTPQMAPLNLMYREYLDSLGGLDSRYISGQYENDIMMRVYADGGHCIKYEDKRVRIEHIKKHGKTSKFWKSYDHDRKILEDTWVIGGYKPLPKVHTCINPGNTTHAVYPHRCISNNEVSDVPLLPFEPFSKDLSLTKSESYHEGWE